MRGKSLSDYRDKILRITAKMLSEGGPEKVSMRKVASAAGISVGGIYKLFENKEDLIMEAAKMASVEFKEKVLAIDDIYDILRATMDHSKENKWIIRYLAMKDPSFTRSIFKDILDHMENLLQDRAKARVLFRLASMQGMIGGKEEEAIVWKLIKFLLSEDHS